MDDETDAPSRNPADVFTPELRILGGQRGHKTKMARHANHSISRELYDKAAEIYLKGDRSYSSVARGISISPVTAKRIIEQGYPAKGWPPLKERATLWDRQKVEAESQAHAKHTLNLLDQRERSRQERHAILRFAKAGFSNLIRVWQTETNSATSLHKIATETGKTAISLNALALTGERLMNAFTRFAEMEEKDLNLMAESPDDAAQGGLSSLAGVSAEALGITAEQLDFIVNNGGKLPQGLAPEVVFGTRPNKG